MTDSLGRRVARYRRRLGVSSTRELSELTGGRVSESVLQNIEAGRRPDPSVSQLLEIAYALRIAPVLLLAPMERPLDGVDLPAVGEGIASMRASDFDRWFSGTGTRQLDDFHAPGISAVTGVTLQAALDLVRKVVPDLDELDHSREELEALDRRGSTPDNDAHRQELMAEARFYEERIDSRASQLEGFGFDASWIPRPWRAAPAES